MRNMADSDYKELARKMGVPEDDIPVEEKDQPDDVAEVEVIEYYGDC